MFDILICAYNNLDLSKRCVESVRKYTESGKYKIIFIDDASIDGTRQWAEDQESNCDDFYTNTNFVNIGFVKSVLKGYMVARPIDEANYLFLLNNDIILGACWLDGALELLSDPKVAIIGALGHKEVAGEMVEFISGSRMIIKKKIIDEIGFFDDKFKFGYWEDVDFSRRVQKAGYKIRKYDYFEKFSLHLKGASFKYNENRKHYFEENRKYLERKILGEK